MAISIFSLEKRAKISFYIGLINFISAAFGAVWFYNSITYYTLLNGWVSDVFMFLGLLFPYSPLIALFGMKLGYDGVESKQRRMAEIGFCLSLSCIFIYALMICLGMRN